MKKLERVRGTPAKGWLLQDLATLLRVESLQLEPVLETLCELDWVGRLDEEDAQHTSRYLLLANPDTTLLAPLLDTLLLPQNEVTHHVWKTSLWPNMVLREAL